MKQVSIYSTSTGQILRTFTGLAHDLNLNIREGEACISGIHSPSQFYVVDAEAVDIPACPGEWAEWDWASLTWIDPRDAAWYAAQTEALWAALRVERDRRIAEVQWRIDRNAAQIELDLPTTESRAALLTYVQALRDLPETTTDPANPVWPVAPNL